MNLSIFQSGQNHSSSKEKFFKNALTKQQTVQTRLDGMNVPGDLGLHCLHGLKQAKG
jgi:hypothetical protein